jgi:tetratricopeptide (TPR) repeat protein
VLVFFLLKRMTAALWPSAFAAALFAIHPLRAESVAWVTERKDVLSVFFGLLTIWAYVAFSQKSAQNNTQKDPLPRYLLMLALYATGLMAKPMLVTLPALLLLLDYWPLKRAQTTSDIMRRLVEKIPLFLLATISSVVTYMAQKGGGAVTAIEEYPLPDRAGNALLSYVGYLANTFWPQNLAIFYPYPEGLPAWQVAGAALLLGAITVFTFRVARSMPFFVVGWLWYLISLTPVIGIIQVGGQAMADRYTYIPTLGIFIAIAWGVPALLYASGVSVQRATRICALAAVAVIAALALVARVEVGYWKDSVSIFSRAVRSTERNHVAHGNLGLAFWTLGRTDEAIAQLKQSIAIKPNSEISLNVLGGALLTQRRIDEAEIALEKALAINPDYSPALFNLGLVLFEQGRPHEAIDQYRRALTIAPDSYKTHSALAVALSKIGDTGEARIHFQKALDINPNDIGARNSFGNMLADMGMPDEALEQFTHALGIAPGNPMIHYNTGIIYERLGRREHAIAEFETTLKLKPDHAGAKNMLDSLQRK